MAENAKGSIKTPGTKKTPEVKKTPESKKTPEGKKTLETKKTPDGKETPESKETPETKNTPDHVEGKKKHKQKKPKAEKKTDNAIAPLLASVPEPKIGTTEKAVVDTAQQENNSTTEQKSKEQLKAERRAIQEAQRAAKEAKKTEDCPAQSKVSSGKGNDSVIITDQIKSTGDKTGESSNSEQKSKAQLRAERRAIQEAQRAAKEAKKVESTPAPTTATTVAAVKKEVTKDKTVEKKPKKATPKKEVVRTRKDIEIIGKNLKVDNKVLELGLQYFSHDIIGANARCVAMLKTLQEVIGNYKTPDKHILSRDIEKSCINPCLEYFNQCRPLSISMDNAIKYLKYYISLLPDNMKDEVAINNLQALIERFYNDKIQIAAVAIAEYATGKINNDDVILVYAGSSLIMQVLTRAHKAGKRFRVIVVEGRPRTEGKTMLRYLVRCGIPCSYVYIGSATYVMSQVTKVFLGAAAMFATGDMYSRCGNSIIAALAKANKIPVLVCCETYKFTDKVQLSSGDNNLHATTDLVKIGNRIPILCNHQQLGLGLSNIMYDLTGSKYITCLISELGVVISTAVPAILRRQEDLLETVFPVLDVS